MMARTHRVTPGSLNNSVEYHRAMEARPKPTAAMNPWKARQPRARAIRKTRTTLKAVRIGSITLAMMVNPPMTLDKA